MSILRALAVAVKQGQEAWTTGLTDGAWVAEDTAQESTAAANGYLRCLIIPRPEKP